MARAGNNHKGGRPKGSVGANTLRAQKIREYILKQIEKELAPMIAAMINKVKKGDTLAFKELLDRAMGKATESIDVTSNGQTIVIPGEIAIKNGLSK